MWRYAVEMTGVTRQPNNCLGEDSNVGERRRAQNPTDSAPFSHMSPKTECFIVERTLQGSVGRVSPESSQAASSVSSRPSFRALPRLVSLWLEWPMESKRRGRRLPIWHCDIHGTGHKKGDAGKGKRRGVRISIFHFAHNRFDEVAGVPAKNNFKRWGAPAGGSDSLGKEGSDHQVGRASLPEIKSLLSWLGWLSASSCGIFWEEAVYFQRELWVFGTKVEGIPPGGRKGMNEMEVMFGVRTLAKGKRWRESKEEGDSECCLGASCDWPVYRGGAAKGRFSLAVHGCSSFGRTRNGTGACPASDLTCRRDDGTPSFLSLLRLVLIRVFFVAGWCLCPVVHAVWGQTASHDPNGPNQDQSHHSSLTSSCLARHFPLAAEKRKEAVHLGPAFISSRDGCRIGGPSDAGTGPQRAITTANILSSETC